MTTVVLAVLLVGIFFLLMSVRLIFVKGGKFRGTCASQSPFLHKEGASCGMCGRKVESGDECKSEVNKVLSKFK
jgi:hypothetical protein